MTTANILTLIRMAMIPVFLVFAYLGGDYAIITAVIFTLASVTDFVDGYIARKYNQVTDFGKLVDPLADKLLVMSALLVFVERGILPVWGAALIIGREFAITSLRMIAASKGIVIAAAKSGKIKTLVQCVLTILLLVLGDNIIAITSWLTVQSLSSYIMIAVAVISMVDYFVVNRGVLKGSMSKQN